MRQLLPHPLDDVDVVEVYAADHRPAPPDRPWVVVDMIASVDGAISVGGRSGPLGGPGDKRVFSALRGVADVVLVGAGTVRVEGYGPPRTPPAQRQRRAARGQTPTPRMAVVSGRLDLDFAAPLFTAAEERPLVVTATGADGQRVDRARSVADVVQAGGDEVDLGGALRQLRAAGAVVLVEGGPRLNAHLLAQGLIDELCLSVSPSLVGGSAPRAIEGGDAEALQWCRLERVLEEDGFLFLRYLRR